MARVLAAAGNECPANMIASFRHRFIFLKTMKTAGTSFEMAIAGHCGPDDIVTPIDPGDEQQRMIDGVVQARNYSDPASEAAYRRAIAAGPSELSERILQALPRHRFTNHMSAAEVRALVPDLWENSFKFTIERHPFEKVDFDGFHARKAPASCV